MSDVTLAEKIDAIEAAIQLCSGSMRATTALEAVLADLRAQEAFQIALDHLPSRLSELAHKLSSEDAQKGIVDVIAKLRRAGAEEMRG